jgi:hypothetical protein
MALSDIIQPGNLKLMETVTATANGEWFRWPGGSGSYFAWGTFGGSDAVKLQVSPDDGTTAIDVTAASFTANATGEFQAGICLVRAVATIADTSSFNVVLGVPRKRS